MYIKLFIFQIKSLISLLNEFFIFSYKKILFSIIQNIYILLMITGCGYQLSPNIFYNKLDNTANIKQLTISLHSYDPFHSITRSIKNELYLNCINVIEDNDHIPVALDIKNIPHLDIISISTKHIIVSVFEDGTESEYQINLRVQATYSIANKNNQHPMIVQVYRTFIRNPEENLSNTVQENEILEDMYRDAAQKIVYQFLTRL